MFQPLQALSKITEVCRLKLYVQFGEPAFALPAYEAPAT